MLPDSNLPPQRSSLSDCQHIGQQILHYNMVGSTNDIALELASNPSHSGTVILAEMQTKGRGQYSRTWQAPPKSSLLMSILLFPPPELRRPAVLTAWAAVSIGETILELTGLQARIKWPNDLLIRGKKVCGILIECGVQQSENTSERSIYAIIGIGLNLNQSAEDFQQLQLPEATSLSMSSGKRFEMRTVADQLIRHLDREYARLLAGEQMVLEACWKWRIGLLGKEVSIEFMDGKTQSGRLLEMAFDGFVIELANGSLETIIPEAVRHLFEVRET